MTASLALVLMRGGCIAIVFHLAACATTSTQPSPPEDRVPEPPKSPAAAAEHRAVVRIAATPGGKKEQPVWLEFDGDERWVIDYRARELWRGFEDAAVTVTGTCYQPYGQALLATHFKVERLKFAAPPTTSVPFFAIGPEILVRGSFQFDVAPAGSKAADDGPRLVFRADEGTSFSIAGSAVPTPPPGAAAINARSVELNPAYAATTGGPHIWILSVHDVEYVPETRDVPRPCPR